MIEKMPKEERQQMVTNLQNYFQEKQWSEIGNLEAEQLLSFIMDDVSPYIYNAALQDARKLIIERMENVEEDLYTLEKPTSK
ncbi:DUF2164 domain-containing protein [Ectobacillus sp. sgz5001026]|uniref:DUF2164 domain-containing protein n=1 Tax=Ectobacillus sp. sgz5001026 TaxID=3242473 RepID=UPI0036D3BC6C